MKTKINNKADICPGESRKPIGRRERRSEETRENIFRAALQLFAERGFNATTIEAITEAADVGKGTFFNYFENKESLLLEYGELQMGKIRTFVADGNELKSITGNAHVRACSENDRRRAQETGIIPKFNHCGLFKRNYNKAHVSGA